MQERRVEASQAACSNDKSIRGLSSHWFGFMILRDDHQPIILTNDDSSVYPQESLHDRLLLPQSPGSTIHLATATSLLIYFYFLNVLFLVFHFPKRVSELPTEICKRVLSSVVWCIKHVWAPVQV